MNLEQVKAMQRQQLQQKRKRYFHNEKLNRYMKENNIKNTYVADMLGVDRSYISHWRKEGHPGYFLNIELHELFEKPEGYFTRPKEER